MAVNRFAITTDGFKRPPGITGSDFGNKIGRALYLTGGYFNRALFARAGRSKKSKFWQLFRFFYRRG